MFKVRNMTEALLTISADVKGLGPLLIPASKSIEVSEVDVASNYASVLGVMSSAGMIKVVPADAKEQEVKAPVKEVEPVVETKSESAPVSKEEYQSDKIQLIKAEIKALDVS